MAYFVGPVLPGFGVYLSSVLMSASGRKLTFDSRLFGGYERPVSVRADIRPDRTSAFHPKAAMGLELI
jgi:hypothetical protein